MPRYRIQDFSKGLNTSQNPTQLEEGEARISQNLLHDYPKRAKLRDGVLRYFATRFSNSLILGLFQYIATDGTATNIIHTGGSIRTFNTVNTTQIDSGQQQLEPTRFTQAFAFWLMADARDNNYIGNATTGYPFQVAAPTTAITAVDSGGGSGPNGTYIYTYARYSSVTGELSPASTTTATVTVTDNTITVGIGGIAATEQFDQVRLYRTKASGTQYYEVTTLAIASLPYSDSNADTALTTISTLHTSAGASKTDRPAAATDICFHRGRIHVVGLSGNRSRQRWSQIGSYSFDSTTAARHDVEADDGDFLWRCFSWGGGMILMKDHSIHLMNGDVNENNFTWQVASDKNAGIGAYCPYTAVATPIGIIFLSEYGVYNYRPGIRPELLSGPVSETIAAANYTYRTTFVGGYDPDLRAYYVSYHLTESGVSNGLNNRTLVYFIDTGRWTRFDFGVNNFYPHAYASFLVSSRMKLFFGGDNGYVYQTNTGVYIDGVNSGTTAGTTTGGSDTTVVDTGATFYTTGNGLLGVPVTVADSSSTFESQEISSNTGTTLTTGSWTTDPSSGKSYYVGALDAILSLGRTDFGDSGYKFISRMTFEFQKQSHAVNLLVGFTVDSDTEPTTVTATLQSGEVSISIPVERRCIGISPYIRTVGNAHPFEVLGIEIDFTPLTARKSI